MNKTKVYEVINVIYCRTLFQFQFNYIYNILIKWSFIWQKIIGLPSYISLSTRGRFYHFSYVNTTLKFKTNSQSTSRKSTTCSRKKINHKLPKKYKDGEKTSSSFILMYCKYWDFQKSDTSLLHTSDFRWKYQYDLVRNTTCSNFSSLTLGFFQLL